MAGFALGAYLATLIVMPETATNALRESANVVWPPRVTYALAVSLLRHVAFITWWIVIGGSPSGSTRHGLLALWPLAMGMQSAAIRWLNVGGVFTTAATATFIFFFGSFTHHPLTWEERRQLSGVLVSLIIGATAGARLLIDAPTYASLLPLAVTSVVVAIAAKAIEHRDNSHVLR